MRLPLVGVMRRCALLVLALIAIAEPFSPAPLLAGPAPKEYQDISELSLDDLLGQVVVTATRRESAMETSPATMYVITEEDIRRSPALTLSDLLRRVPGFQTKTWLSEFTNTSLRGMVGASVINERILWMIDGVPVNDVRDGGIWTDITIPLSHVKRIEVLSGPGSALYGANAFLGVVHIITRDPEDYLHDDLTGKFQTSFETYDTVLSELAVAGNNGGASWLWDLHLDSTTGPGITRDRNRPGADKHSDRQWGYLYGKYKFGNNKLNVGMRRVDQEYDGADFAVYDLYKWRRGEEWIDWHHGKTRENGDRDSLVLSWHGYDEDFYHFADIPNLNYDIDSYRWYLNLQRDMCPRGRHRISFGTGLRSEHYRGDDFIPTRRSFSKENFNLFFQDEINLAHLWKVTVGGRFDTHTDYENVFSPHVTVLHTFADTKGHVRFGYGRAFKEPSSWQLYIDQPSGRGTPDMQPEKIRTFELSIDYMFPRELYARVTGFNMKHRNIIWENFDPLIAENQYKIFGIFGKFHPQQPGDSAHIHGAEFELLKHFDPRNHLFLTGMWLRSRDDQSRDLQYDAERKAGIGYWHAFDSRTNMQVESHWVDDTIDTNKRDVPGIGTRHVSGYTVTGAALRYALSAKEHVKLSVWNIGRKPYQEMLEAWAPGTVARLEFIRSF
ncbi:MAG TPA: TonB-dependent receptor [Candidatus Ozemobacteraceae bacterium]|nr:TonB-dependent receptor [Candidatus Ozemobacteraceae bacterium]